MQKEGVLFSDNKNSALIYHTPGISSLETSKKLLFINLDCTLDHPFAHLPYQANEGGKWVNLSRSNIKVAQSDSFSIFINPVQKTIPRLMLVPSGYRAGKRSGEETIFWFDIAPQQTIKLAYN